MGQGGEFKPHTERVLAEHKKEFKHMPELESNRKLIREGLSLHRQEYGVLSEAESERDSEGQQRDGNSEKRHRGKFSLYIIL